MRIALDLCPISLKYDEKDLSDMTYQHGLPDQKYAIWIWI